MTTYASTFIPGFGEIVAAALEQALLDVEIVLLLDGLVLFRSTSGIADVRAVRFFNNSFVCVMTFEGLGRNPIAQMGESVFADGKLAQRLAPYLPTKQLTYRFVAAEANRFVAMPRRMRAELERLLAGERWLRPDRSNPDVEFWLLARREGLGLVGLRLTRHTAYEKTLAQGELRPELCHLLCLISEPSATDVVLDPFCGSGAIPLERARAFSYRKVLAGDHDAQAIKSLRKRVRRQGKDFAIGRWDALNLHTFAPNSVDRIITDPPWGYYRAPAANLTDFLRSTLEEFHRVLRSGGLVVLLLGQPKLLEACLRDAPAVWALEERYDILVSGKKASVLKLRKEASLVARPAGGQPHRSHSV